MPISVERPSRNRRGNGQPPNPGNPAPEQPSASDTEQEAHSGAKPLVGINDAPDRDWDLLNIPLDQIEANPFNDRDMGDLTDLAESLQLPAGLLEPVSVMHREVFQAEYPDDPNVAQLTAKYTLGFGERRWRAHAIAGKKRVRAVLRNDLAPTIQEELLKENWHRKPPTELEEARGFSRLARQGYSTRQIAKAMGIRDHTKVKRRLDLLLLPPVVQEAIELGAAKGGIGPTNARKLLQLDDEAQRIQAWDLMRTERLTADDAMKRVILGPQRTSDDADPTGSAGETAGAAGVQSNAQPDVDNPSEDKDEAPGDEAAEETQPKPEQKPVAPPKKKLEAPADKAAYERRVGSSNREQACVHLLRRADASQAQGVAVLLSRALLVPVKQDHARSRAHAWLTESGSAELNVRNTESYFEAVLSSPSRSLIEHVTFATALAAGEVRAADRRRPSWDAHDAAFVKFLMDAAGYVPDTQWEKRELTRLGVALSNTKQDESERSETESL